jgi:cytoskeletal protein CcmA (bactofilin family)
MSIFCPHCSKRVILENYYVKGYHASRDFATAGDIVVERRGTVTAPIKTCNLVVKGDVKGSVLARGSVEVTGTGHLRGDVTAPSLVVRQGGSFEGFCRIGAGTS